MKLSNTLDLRIPYREILATIKKIITEIAGATDILISYTYKIAFGTNIQNLGLASAISVIIFLIVASISLYGIRRSKVLDSFK